MQPFSDLLKSELLSWKNEASTLWQKDSPNMNIYLTHDSLILFMYSEGSFLKSLYTSKVVFTK